MEMHHSVKAKVITQEMCQGMVVDFSITKGKRMTIAANLTNVVVLKERIPNGHINASTVIQLSMDFMYVPRELQQL